MATYAELYNLRNYGPLRDKVAVSITIKAQVLLALANPTEAQVVWAKTALAAPTGMADQLIHYVLAANKAATVAQIQSADDATVQTNVDAAVDKIIAGGG
jgi:hypothetical protein